jgi:hypothetical protein
METWSFIGSDKNAGKTTALNFVHRRLHEQGKGPLCLTAIGINGESVDNYDNRPKPQFPVFRGEYFVSAMEHLTGHQQQYEELLRFTPPSFNKQYLLGRCRDDFSLVVEGPNDRRQLLLLKERLRQLLPGMLLLIDGSIDRQFIADPRLSDAIFFALLISDRVEQQRKAGDLLTALQLPATDPWILALFKGLLHPETRSLLLDEQHLPLYRNQEIPFLDQELKAVCRRHRQQQCLLYLNGALSLSLFDFLADFDRFQVVLNNFTLYQNVSVHEGLKREFAPQLSLLQPLRVKRIFVNRQAEVEMPLPAEVPVTDLFRDEVDDLVF